MDTNHIILIFFCGQFWISLSTEMETPPKTLSSTVSQTQSRDSLGEKKGSATLKFSSQLATSRKPEKPLAFTMTTQITSAKASETSDGSMIAALFIGTILSSMMIAIIVILLWKCSKNSAPVDPNWAGRSPFADGHTPDMVLENFKEMDQATKRTSIFSILPWKFNRNTQMLDNAEGTVSEKRPETTPSCNTKEKSSPSSPTLQGDSGPSAANISVATSNNINVPSPPGSDGQNVCDPPLDPILPAPESPPLNPILPAPESPPLDPILPAPESPPLDPILPAPESPPLDPILPAPESPPLDPILPAPESLDLPPPPPWLNELQENHCSEISKSDEFNSEAESQLPPPPD